MMALFPCRACLTLLEKLRRKVLRVLLMVIVAHGAWVICRTLAPRRMIVVGRLSSITWLLRNPITCLVSLIRVRYR